MTIVVVGAGPTGVEIAGQIRELAVRSLRRNFRTFDPASVRVLLIDGGTAPLATFGDGLSARAAKALEKLGVELRMAFARHRYRRRRCRRRNERRDRAHRGARIKIWAAGVQASPLAGMLATASGAETDRAGRIATLPDLTLPSHPEVFAVGDMVALNGLPGVAEVAMQGSLHAANTIVRRLDGKSTKPYKYRDLGSVAAISRFEQSAACGASDSADFRHGSCGCSCTSRSSTASETAFGALWSWFWAMVGRKRHQRIFSVAHIGGDLSAPESVRAIISPNPFPAVQPQGPESE